MIVVLDSATIRCLLVATKVEPNVFFMVHHQLGTIPDVPIDVACGLLKYIREAEGVPPLSNTRKLSRTMDGETSVISRPSILVLGSFSPLSEPTNSVAILLHLLTQLVEANEHHK